MAITSDNARELQQKAVASRKLRQEQKQAEAFAALTAAMAQQLPEYVAARLARVRLQLDRLDQMLMDESDPQKLDRLASAQSRLSEQERQLSGRPMPGSLKPSNARSSRSRPSEPSAE